MLVPAVLAMTAACGGEAGDSGASASESWAGYDSQEECLVGLPKVETGIDASELAEDCSVTAERASAALQLTAPATTAPPPAAPPSSAAPEPVAAVDETPGVMPDLICWNLQDAQDEIQRSGVFFSDSQDASGQGRSQLIDSNWVVVEQDPSPGTEIGEGDAVLYVLKYEDPNPC